MKIYLDLVLFLNFIFDFLLLITTSILLRRRVKLYRIFIGALVGSLSILFLFIKITSLQLFLLKLVVSLIMVLITFGYKNLKYTLKNLGYLYMTSIILGGFLYFLNLQLSYKNEGIVFFHQGLSINYIFLIIFSPIILYIYIKQGIRLRRTYTNYYKVHITMKDKVIKCIGYLDTGNNLIDHITNKPVILINPSLIKKIPKYYFTYFNGPNDSGLIKCFRVDKVIIEKYGFYKNVVLGVMHEDLKLDGVDCLLNNRMERTYDSKN